MKPFLALTEQDRAEIFAPLIAVDLGYSSRRSSCGIASTPNGDTLELQFGEAIIEVRDRLARSDWKALLVLEAALSTYHLENGNPSIRGEFETGRGWYHGAGALSLVAARRFLFVLAQQIPNDVTVKVAEAFLSNKIGRSRHSEDAIAIRDGFWDLAPAPMYGGVEPCSEFMEGVPSVHVFESLPAGRDHD